MALVLCTGRDPALMQTRRFILEGVGHQVVVAMNEREIVTACKQHSFDVAVIGQVISNEEKKGLFEANRAHTPSSKVLELYAAFHGRVLESADEYLSVPVNVPQELAVRVTLLAKRQEKDRAERKRLASSALMR